MSDLSNSFERSAMLAKLELEKSELLDGKIGSVSALLNDYRDARLQELVDLLAAEETWLRGKNWRARTGTGRFCTVGEQPGGGINLVCERADGERQTRSEIIVEFRYDQVFYQVYLSDVEEQSRQSFFFVQEVLARIGELIFEQEQIFGI